MGLVIFLKKVLSHFNSKNSSQMAAALSYYSLFAIAPIFLILFFVLELFLSDIQTKQAIIMEVRTILTPEIARVITNIIENIASFAPPSNITGIIGIVILLVSSTNVVRELQRALNTMWEIQPTKVSVSQRFRKRLIAFFFLIILGILLLFSFIFNTVLSSFGEYIAAFIGFDPTTLYIINLLISLLTVSILFILLFRYLPDSTVSWTDNIIGAVITGILFILGKHIISYVLGHTAYDTFYGTAGTALVFLLWVYYTSLIFLFGAACTYIFAKEHGKGVTFNN